MRIPDRPVTAPSPWRRAIAMAAVGAGAAFAVLALGRVSERVALGATDADARSRVEASVRADFIEMSTALRLMALGVADAESVEAAARDDVTAARRLFAATESALASADIADLALTAYGADGRPLAWEGRPSELPAERLAGEETWFLAQGALGLRLVYVTPVRASDGLRVGTIAAERSLSPAAPTRPDPDLDDFQYVARLAPVSIALRFEGEPPADPSSTFAVTAPSGALLFTATLDAADLQFMRSRWRMASTSLALITLALAVALSCGVLLDWRSRSARPGPYLVATACMAGVIAISRLLLVWASPARWSAHTAFSSEEYGSRLLGPLLASPFDFLLTATALTGFVVLLLGSVDVLRLARLRRRPSRFAIAAHVAAGALMVAALIGHEAFLRHTVASTTLDLLHFSLHPWSLPRVAVQIALVLSHATALGVCVFLLRAADALWPVPWTRGLGRIASAGLWCLPALAWHFAANAAELDRLLPLVAFSVAIGLATFARPLSARYRRGSQGLRLIVVALGLIVPAVAFYPVVYQLGRQAKAQLVEAQYAPQAIEQRQTTQQLLQESLRQIDAFPDLEELALLPRIQASAEAPTDRAFQLWRVTGLAAYPVTSSIEIYGPDGVLVSRFAFNLPDDLAATSSRDEQTCAWDIYEEVSPFFAEERRILHASRALCGATGQPAGSIVAHAMLDYANLPFIQSQSPYLELMRPADPRSDEGVPGQDIEFAFYGWSRRPLYTSAVTAWPLDDAAFEVVERTRAPVWASLRRDDLAYDVYLLNDRGGIYALGFPVPAPLDHLVNLAELAVLACGTLFLLLAMTELISLVRLRATTARALLRELRASFYRKVLFVFVLATVVPVAALAITTRAYVADQMRSNVEQDAVRTAAVARRVVEDLVAPRATQQGAAVDDNLMVWVSRLIEQDVNIFAGPRLMATSERNLFASGLLPTRTPASVYRAIALGSDASIVVREQLGDQSYLVAATPMATQTLTAVLTVPLTARELQIEAQIDTLDRRVLLGALLFVFCGASIGYWLTERIADPINRLTRATRRIARGEFDARIAASSADELGRLVQDFNTMAGELQRQHRELERTHRLEAWAEMARQVAHEIKNPLTPIQLNAEHLRRVHADRGQPLSPVLEECVGTILEQVRLLRQIASEFSNFASSPAVKRAPVRLQDLVQETLEPYRAGLGTRVRLETELPDDLPAVFADRTLLARAVTNLVENALHAMPATGVLTITAWAEPGAVRMRCGDTGVGMDAEALARAFEPYFSTKTTGTGLGLPIAKRNIELNGGTISLSSAPGHGTTVEIGLPTVAAEG